MTDDPQSLVVPQVQLALWDESAMPAGRELLTIEARRCTGEAIARDQARYAAIVRALAEGVGIRATARAFSVSPKVVMAIRDREGLAIASERRELSTLAGQFLRLGMERLIEESDALAPRELAVAVGIVADKQLAWQAGEIEEQPAAGTELEDKVRSYLEALRSAAVDPTSATGPAPPPSEAG